MKIRGAFAQHGRLKWKLRPRPEWNRNNRTKMQICRLLGKPTTRLVIV